MSIFSNPTFFFIGISILLMVSVLFFWSEKKKKSKLLKITSIKLLPRLLPYHSQKRKLIKFGLFGLAVLLLSFAFGLLIPDPKDFYLYAAIGYAGICLAVIVFAVGFFSKRSSFLEETKESYDNIYEESSIVEQD